MKKMKTIHYVVIILVIGLLASCSRNNNLTSDDMVELAKSKVELVTPDQLFEIMSGDDVYTLIDVRSPLEYYPGYISGAVLLSRGSLEFQIGQEKFWEDAGLYMPAKDETIILYCKKGNRGILATETLLTMGYTKVFALEGGFKNWELTYPDYVEKNLEALGTGGSTHDMGGGC